MRLQLSKSSVKKYTAMQNSVCTDNRARGMFGFYRASRSGRYGSQIVQLQNLPQNHIEGLESVRKMAKNRDFQILEMLYDSVPDVLSQLIRTAFIPKRKFIVADFSAIEARVLAWIADEKWRMEAFAKGEDIYCASASKMFGVKVVKYGENGHLRQKGKVAELACGYGGSVGAMKAMGGEVMGLSEAELKQIVDDWRTASPNIVKLWHSVEKCAKETITKQISTKTNGLVFTYESGFMFIQLPSKRRLAYAKPKIGVNKFGGEAITYMGIGIAKKWERLETFGGKLVENIVQGIARDILCSSMKTLSEYFIVAHVHDEIIIDAPENLSLESVCEQMAKVPDWADGLELRADGYECEFYKKD
jgi:DNA polymerase